MIIPSLRQLALVLLTFSPGAVLQAGKVTFARERFSVDIPADWEKGKGPDDGAILYRDAPGGEGSFSIYQLPVAKDHRANLEGTLAERVKAIRKAGLKVSAEVKSQKQDNFDGKPAIFAVVPIEASYQDQIVKFTYYLVLIDARNSVIIMQAALPRPLTPKLQQGALGIIQSFREKKQVP